MEDANNKLRLFRRHLVVDLRTNLFLAFVSNEVATVVLRA